MHVHGAGLPGKIVVPDGVEDVVPGQDGPPVLTQELQKLKFLIGQLHRNAVPADLPGGGVDLQVAAGEHALSPGAPGPAEQGLHPGLELHDAEGLHHIVVRPLLQALHPVQLGGAGGEHDDGNMGRIRRPPQTAQNLQPVHPRQHDVQDIEVGLHVVDRLKVVLPGFKVLHSVPHRVKIIAEHLADALVILDDRNQVRHAASSFPYGFIPRGSPGGHAMRWGCGLRAGPSRRRSPTGRCSPRGPRCAPGTWR